MNKKDLLEDIDFQNFLEDNYGVSIEDFVQLKRKDKDVIYKEYECGCTGCDCEGDIEILETLDRIENKLDKI